MLKLLRRHPLLPAFVLLAAADVGVLIWYTWQPTEEGTPVTVLLQNHWEREPFTLARFYPATGRWTKACELSGEDALRRYGQRFDLLKAQTSDPRGFVLWQSQDKKLELVRYRARRERSEWRYGDALLDASTQTAMVLPQGSMPGQNHFVEQDRYLYCLKLSNTSVPRVWSVPIFGADGTIVSMSESPGSENDDWSIVRYDMQTRHWDIIARDCLSAAPAGDGASLLVSRRAPGKVMSSEKAQIDRITEDGEHLAHVARLSGYVRLGPLCDGWVALGDYRMGVFLVPTRSRMGALHVETGRVAWSRDLRLETVVLVNPTQNNGE